MISLLNEYLLQHQSLYLMDIGMLRLKRVEAAYDVADHLLKPPRQQIQLEESGDSHFIQPMIVWLARKANLTEEQAYGVYLQFCKEVNAALDDNGFFAWEPLGLLARSQHEAKASFELNERIGLLRQDIHAERVARQGVAHAMQVGDNETTTVQMQQLLEQEPAKRPDRWWIWPLITALVALSLIFWKRWA